MLRNVTGVRFERDALFVVEKQSECEGLWHESNPGFAHHATIPAMACTLPRSACPYAMQACATKALQLGRVL